MIFISTHCIIKEELWLFLKINMVKHHRKDRMVLHHHNPGMHKQPDLVNKQPDLVHLHLHKHLLYLLNTKENINQFLMVKFTRTMVFP